MKEEKKGGLIDKETGTRRLSQDWQCGSLAPPLLCCPELPISSPHTTIHASSDRIGSDRKGKEEFFTNTYGNTQSSSETHNGNGGIRWPATERVPGGFMALHRSRKATTIQRGSCPSPQQIVMTPEFESTNPYTEELRRTASSISQRGKGILASDESNAITGKRSVIMLTSPIVLSLSAAH